MSTGGWISIAALVLCFVLLVVAAHFALDASNRAMRIEKFLAHLEHRVILIERNVHRELLKDGIPREDLPHVHDILPAFREVEHQMRQVWRKAR